MGSSDASASGAMLNLAELFKREDSSIQRIRADNLFKQLDERQLTDQEERIIQQRVELQRRMFQEFQRREEQRKMKELQAVLPAMDLDAARRALEACNWKEEEATVRFSSDPAFQRMVLRQGPPLPPGKGANRRPTARPSGQRPRVIDATLLASGGVFVGRFKSKLGPYQSDEAGRAAVGGGSGAVEGQAGCSSSSQGPPAPTPDPATILLPAVGVRTRRTRARSTTPEPEPMAHSPAALSSASGGGGGAASVMGGRRGGSRAAGGAGGGRGRRQTPTSAAVAAVAAAAGHSSADEDAWQEAGGQQQACCSGSRGAPLLGQVQGGDQDSGQVDLGTEDGQDTELGVGSRGCEGEEVDMVEVAASEVGEEDDDGFEWGPLDLTQVVQSLPLSAQQLVQGAPAAATGPPTSGAPAPAAREPAASASTQLLLEQPAPSAQVPLVQLPSTATAAPAIPPAMPPAQLGGAPLQHVQSGDLQLSQPAAWASEVQREVQGQGGDEALHTAGTCGLPGAEPVQGAAGAALTLTHAPALSRGGASVLDLGDVGPPGRPPPGLFRAPSADVSGPFPLQPLSQQCLPTLEQLTGQPCLPSLDQEAAPQQLGASLQCDTLPGQQQQGAPPPEGGEAPQWQLQGQEGGVAPQGQDTTSLQAQGLTPLVLACAAPGPLSTEAREGEGGVGEEAAAQPQPLMPPLGLLPLQHTGPQQQAAPGSGPAAAGQLPPLGGPPLGLLPDHLCPMPGQEQGMWQGTPLPPLDQLLAMGVPGGGLPSMDQLAALLASGMLPPDQLSQLMAACGLPGGMQDPLMGADGMPLPLGPLPDCDLFAHGLPPMAPCLPPLGPPLPPLAPSLPPLAPSLPPMAPSLPSAPLDPHTATTPCQASEQLLGLEPGPGFGLGPGPMAGLGPGPGLGPGGCMLSSAEGVASASALQQPAGTATQLLQALVAPGAIALQPPTLVPPSNAPHQAPGPGMHLLGPPQGAEAAQQLVSGPDPHLPAGSAPDPVALSQQIAQLPFSEQVALLEAVTAMAPWLRLGHAPEGGMAGEAPALQLAAMAQMAAAGGATADGPAEMAGSGPGGVIYLPDISAFPTGAPFPDYATGAGFMGAPGFGLPADYTGTLPPLPYPSLPPDRSAAGPASTSGAPPFPQGRVTDQAARAGARALTKMVSRHAQMERLRRMAPELASRVLAELQMMDDELAVQLLLALQQEQEQQQGHEQQQEQGQRGQRQGQKQGQQGRRLREQQGAATQQQQEAWLQQQPHTALTAVAPPAPMHQPLLPQSRQPDVQVQVGLASESARCQGAQPCTLSAGGEAGGGLGGAAESAGVCGRAGSDEEETQTRHLLSQETVTDVSDREDDPDLDPDPGEKGVGGQGSRHMTRASSGAGARGAREASAAPGRAEQQPLRRGPSSGELHPPSGTGQGLENEDPNLSPEVKAVGGHEESDTASEEEQTKRRGARGRSRRATLQRTARQAIAAPSTIGSAAISARGHTKRGRIKQKGTKKADLVEVGNMVFQKPWCNAGYIFTSGFKSRLLFRSSVNLDALCVHECEILGEGGEHWPAPTFSVKALDRPDEPIIAKSCTGCWSGILRRINDEIEARRAEGQDLPPPPKTAIAGPEYFGLNQPEVVEAIEALDPQHQHQQYWSGKAQREAVLSGGVPESVPRGSSAAQMRGGGGGRGGARGRKRTHDSDEERLGLPGVDEDGYAGNRWSAVSRAQRYRQRCVDAGDSAGLLDDDNPLPGTMDPITLEPVVNPAISPYGHVMGLATWKAVLQEHQRCPFTKTPLTVEQLVVLNTNNIERYRNRIRQP